MSKNKDYTKYSREIKNADEPVETKDVYIVTEPVETKDVHIVTEPVAEEVVNEPKCIEPLPPKSGHVTECIKLNVRKEPSTNAEVIGTVNRGDSLIIDPSPFGDFYKVITPYGVEGYCMKKFVYVND